LATPNQDKNNLFRGCGVTYKQIVTLVRDGIALTMLKEHFESELLRGKARANAQIMSGNVTAAIWWNKTQIEWTEKRDDLFFNTAIS